MLKWQKLPQKRIKTTQIKKHRFIRREKRRSSRMGKAVGIDLGTTFSAVAIMEGDKPIIIPNAEGQRTTPSVVSFLENGERVVGVHARRQALLKPDRTVYSIKRKMGTRYRVKIDDKEYSPEEISAMILQKLKADAEAYLGEPVTEAVITVPAYFNDLQRKATRDAGEIAGLKVLRIINEPTAACLAYGLDKLEEDLTVLVFDFGGGTFDVSILEMSGGVFEVKATSGDNFLGGDDIDRRLMDYLIDDFKKKEGVDLSKDPYALQRLKDAAEQAKIELSTKTQTQINIPYITVVNNVPKHLDVTITRAQFENLIMDIVKRTIPPIKQALADAKLTPQDIDRVLLVGGSTRIPLVQRLVKETLGIEPSKDINPDECVALGAAIQAAIIKGDVKSDILLLDVTPLTLGVETLGGVMTPIIERNTKVPVRRSKIFTTAADNQTQVEIHVLQGERPLAKDNKSLGRFYLTGIPPAPRGVPQIEVTFDIDANGILNVTAKDLATGRKQEIKIESSALSPEEIERMKEEAEKYREEDERRKKLIELRNQLDNLIYNAERLIKDAEGKADAKLLEQLKKQVEISKKELESEDAAKLSDAIKKLEEILQKVAQDLYSKTGQAPGAGAPPGGVPPPGSGGMPGASQTQGSTTSTDQNVVDVDYEVVDE